MIHQALFVCTGNYYRSRFAEILFNHLAKQKNLAWRAFSCGTEVYKYQNEGPISNYTLEALQELKISAPHPIRYPVQVGEWHLEAADVIIALKKTEHQPPLRRDFPHFEKKIVYWHIHDLDFAEPVTALAEVRLHVERLMKKLEGEYGRGIAARV